jgi:predicted lipoprotein with Yx(FWY)xxD motif
MKRIRGSLLIMAAVAAAALTGCGSTASSGTASSVSSPTTAASSSSSESGGSSGSSTSSADLATAQSSLGQIIVDGRGMSVYVFDKDVANSGKSSCTGACLTAWPPVVAKGDAPSMSGITGKVGTITTADGTKQLTINGLPVYYFAKDSAPGDVKGQGVLNLWWVLDPAGAKISMMPGSMAPTSSSAPANSGY